MAEPTKEDVDALVGPATPHFAYQLRARLEELVSGPARQSSREELRAREDGAARPARPRVLEGGGRRAGAAVAARLERGAELGARVRPAPARLMDLAGRSVLVTGGTRGIGKAIALRLVSLGAARVALGYLRNDSAAEAAADEIRAAGAEPILVRGNVASQRAITEFASHGPYAVVVHNAATGVIRAALETEDKHWDWTMATNARALLSLARACAPDMEPGSSIVAISSLGATRVLDNYILVGTSKAALESVVRYLAVELSPRGIRVNAVSASVVETRALEHFPNRDDMLGSVRAHACGTARRAGGRRAARSPSSAHPTPTWCAATRSSSTAASRSSPDGADRAQPSRLGRDPPSARRGARRRTQPPVARSPCARRSEQTSACCICNAAPAKRARSSRSSAPS